MIHAGFEAVYESMVDYVWNVVCRMGVPQADAEDVVQEVFVTVYRRLGEFEGRAQLKTWVFTIAAHLVQHYFRTHARKPGDRASAKGTEIHALVDQRERWAGQPGRTQGALRRARPGAGPTGRG